MGLLKKAEFLKAASESKPPVEDVQVAALGGTVRIRGLTVAERTKYEQSIMTGRGQKRDVRIQLLRERLLVMTIVNEDGSRMFEDSEMHILSGLPASSTERMFDVARRLSGLTDEDVEELGNASGAAAGNDSSSS